MEKMSLANKEILQIQKANYSQSKGKFGGGYYQGGQPFQGGGGY